MRTLPVSLALPTLARIRGLRQSVIWRPGPLLASLVEGDRLWVREPFHLPVAFDGHAPTTALRRFAPRVAYAIDGAPPGYGRRRFAREMPRAAHRMHLLVHSALPMRLDKVTDDECAANGLLDRAHFARMWDIENPTGQSVSGGRVGWADNPPVTRIRFSPVFAPLPAGAHVRPEASPA